MQNFKWLASLFFLLILMVLLGVVLVLYFTVIAPNINFKYHVGSITIGSHVSYQQEFIDVSFGITSSSHLITKIECKKVSKDTAVITGKLNIFGPGLGHEVMIGIPLDNDLKYIRLGGRNGKIIWSRE